MAPQLTLYGSNVSPYVEKVELTLNAGNIPHKYFHIDLKDKPAFYTGQINPIGRVPAITYGGPEVAPDEPSPQSTKLAESNVILEFLADTYPEANLAPTDPIQRARVRFFMDAVTRKYSPVISAWALHDEPQAAEDHLKAIEFIQSLLPDIGEYAIGESYTIADACITPFIYRLRLCVEQDLGRFPVGDGPKFGELLKDAKYGKFMAYANAVMERPSTKEFYALKGEAKKQIWAYITDRTSTFVLSRAHLLGRA